MIEFTHKMGGFKPLAWVLKARGNDDLMPWTKCMYAKDGWITCTNGSRVHRYNFGDGCGWDGLYHVKVCKAKHIILCPLSVDENESMNYPDLDEFFKEHRSKVLVWEGYAPYNCHEFVYRTIMQTQNGWDTDYLKDIHDRASNEYLQIYGDVASEHMFSFIVGHKQEAEAHVMPIRTRQREENSNW